MIVILPPRIYGDGNHMKIKWILFLVGVVLAGLFTFYMDLLKAAFARNPYPQSVASIDRGRLLFQHNCAVCHGPEGRGDGVAALAERPDDLTKIAKSPMFPDGVVAYRIANGVALMPAWRNSLSEDQIWDLVSFIRSIPPAPKQHPLGKT